MKRNQKGFSVVELVIILLVVGGIGFAGYFVMNKNKPSSQQSTSAPDQSTSQTLSPDVKMYTDNVGRFTVEYASSAELAPGSLNSSDAGDVTIKLASGGSVALTSNFGGRGIPIDCTYDEATGVSTWSEGTAVTMAKEHCPYYVYTKAQKLDTTDLDRDGNSQNIYLIHKSVITFTNGKEEEQDAACLVLGIPEALNKKIYGLTFTTEEITSFTKKDGQVSRFIHACVDEFGSSPAFFDQQSTRDAEQVLLSFKFL